MRTRINLLFLVALIYSLSACRDYRPLLSPTLQSLPSETPSPSLNAPTSTPLSSQSPVVRTSPTAIATLLPPPPTAESTTTKLPYYKIDAVLNYAQHHLAVDQQIKYPNHSGEPLQELVLVVEPSRYPGAFSLGSLSWPDGQPVSGYSREIGLLRVPLKTPLQPGESADFSISYEIDMPSPSPEYYGRPVPFGYSNRQTNFVDWYPFIPPYQPGEGWLAHSPSAFGEHLVYEAADFEVNIHILDTNPDLMIAASAAAVKDSDGWRFQLENARNFAWSASDRYMLSTTTIDSILVMSYYFPLDSHAGEAALQTTAESLALYNELFGPYHRQTLTVVEADFLDGMEYDGLYFLSRGFYSLYSGEPGDYLTAIAAHETAHQWWYGAVGNDQAMEPWLDEALSTYCERLYYENKQPGGLDWWWSFRIDYYDPRGFIDGSIYNPQGYRAYRDAVYLNGARFFEDLRNLIGDEPFFDFLAAYAYKYDQKIATGDDFFDLLSDHSQEDLSPLLDEYFQFR